MYEVAADVPQSLCGDPDRLRQILVNLVGNAIKFTPDGEVVVRVALDAPRGRENSSTTSLHFSVTDTGVGIPADKLHLVFESFTQADGSTRRKYGGTGLGLTISKRLIALMGGKIWVESEVGRGTTFHFTAHFQAAQAAPEALLPRKPEQLCGLRVLVVDDNATNRRILAEMLSGWQMQATLAEGGQVALAALRQAAAEGHPFRLILLDAMMPEMDGFAVAEQIQADPTFAGATILMLSSAAQLADAPRCRALGVASYLVKPIRQSELFDAIQAALGASGTIIPKPLRGHQRIRSAENGAAAVPLRILLAEDNVVNQRLAVRLLEKRGHAVVVAPDGQQALAALEREAFDLVLMDVHMPVMDGFEATAALRRREAGTGQHLPVIALTANAMKGDRERCLDGGFDDYVSKPIDAEQLLAVIGRLVASIASENGNDEAKRRSPQPALAEEEL